MLCNFGLFDAYSLSFGSNVATTDYLKPNTFLLMSIFLRAFFWLSFLYAFSKALPQHRLYGLLLVEAIKNRARFAEYLVKSTKNDTRNE